VFISTVPVSRCAVDKREFRSITPMAPRLIASPSRVEAAGQPPKVIDEYVGLVNSASGSVSVARMRSPSDWEEPGQTPEFDEYSIVLDGVLRVEHDAGLFEVRPGQAVHAPAGEWVRYSTPSGADYLSVCLPAFSPERVHRDD
jgi:ethanolamine utilization protein EutQ (cupin superfamily)